ncbi:hypothetical protein G6F24_018559 [Rhizopus arrhizus]|nr:hypothetical protein G6F24_018559 [Rhizopus arrhizus]
MVQHGAVERQHRGHAFNAEFGQCTAGARDRLFARGAGDDQLGQQRIEGAWNGGTGLHADVHAHARAARRMEAGDGARARHEAPRRSA